MTQLCRDCKYWVRKDTFITKKGRCMLKSDYMNVFSCYSNDNACLHFVKKGEE